MERHDIDRPKAAQATNGPAMGLEPMLTIDALGRVRALSTIRPEHHHDLQLRPAIEDWLQH